MRRPGFCALAGVLLALSGQCVAQTDTPAAGTLESSCSAIDILENYQNVVMGYEEYPRQQLEAVTVSYKKCKSLLTAKDRSEIERIAVIAEDSMTWPRNVDKAVKRLLETLSAEEQEKIRVIPEDDLAGLHFGLGLWIRNEFGLWRGNRALSDSMCKEIYCHPDDLSGRLIRAAWYQLQQQSVTPEVP